MYSFGVMLSHWQGIPDFDLMSRSGITFVNVKASEGIDFRDKQYIYNVREARRKGMGVIAFHFYQPNNPVGNVNNFLEATKDYPPDLYELDWEVSGRSKSITVDEICTILGNLKSITEQMPVLYTNPNFGNIYYSYGLNRIPQTLIHVAHYHVGFPGQVKPWVHWHIWQYVKSGYVMGVHGSTSLELTHYPFNNLIELSKRGNINE